MKKKILKLSLYLGRKTFMLEMKLLSHSMKYNYTRIIFKCVDKINTLQMKLDKHLRLKWS